MFTGACRNDPLADTRSGQRRTFNALRAAEGLGVLYSAHDGRVGYENDKLQHGAVGYYLLRGNARKRLAGHAFI
jgi:hypothetical protein